MENGFIIMRSLLGKYKFVIIVLIVDFISKLFISNYFILNKSVSVINKFFYITYTNNYGAAFSIMQNSRFLLIFISVLVLFILVYYLNKKKIDNRLEIFCYSLLLGGLLGNLVDRIIYGYVIDFFDFYIFGYEFAIFNVADVAIVISIIILIFIEFVGDRNAVKS